MAIGDVPNWVTALIGVAAGAGVSGGRDWFANRPDLVYDLGQVREKVWVDRSPGQTLRATQDGLGDLVISLDVLFVNRSGRDDAVLEAWIELPSGAERIDARVYLNEGFGGCNVRAHSATHQRFRFLMPKPDPAQHTQEQLALNFRAISGQVKPASGLQGSAVTIEGLRGSHSPGDDVTFLRKSGN